MREVEHGESGSDDLGQDAIEVEVPGLESNEVGAGGRAGEDPEGAAMVDATTGLGHDGVLGHLIAEPTVGTYQA